MNIFINPFNVSQGYNCKGPEGQSVCSLFQLLNFKLTSKSLIKKEKTK